MWENMAPGTELPQIFCARYFVVAPLQPVLVSFFFSTAFKIQKTLQHTNYL